MALSRGKGHDSVGDVGLFRELIASAARLRLNAYGCNKENRSLHSDRGMYGSADELRISEFRSYSTLSNIRICWRVL